MTIIEGNDIQVYVAMTLRSALRLYMKTGMQVNSSYTPKNMMKSAERITGKRFKARDYHGAIEALTDAIGDGKT